MMSHEITALVGSNPKRTRRGRGTGSGLGKTSGRGHKGQRSRAGKNPPITSEGGQMPLFRRLPKRGFNNYNFTTRYTVVNVSQLESLEGTTQVDAKVLKEAGLIKSESERIKILGDGTLSRSLTVLAHKFSRSAMDKIKSAGGQAQEIPFKQTA